MMEGSLGNAAYGFVAQNRIDEVSTVATPLGIAGRLLIADLQRALIAGSLEHLGLGGDQPHPCSTWVRCLGRVGVPCVRARELFEVIDSERTGEVSPATLCDATLVNKAFTNTLTSSVDLIEIIQLRYRLHILGCRVLLLLDEADVIGIVEFVSACQRLNITMTEENASVFLADMCRRGGIVHDNSRLLEERWDLATSSASQPASQRLPVGVLCHQLAIESTSAPRMPGRTFASNRSFGRNPFLEGTIGHEPSSNQHEHYHGKTPIEIVVQFKNPAVFPWHRLPEATCGRKFEELRALAQGAKHRAAVEAVCLLTDPMYDIGERLPLSFGAPSLAQHRPC